MTDNDDLDRALRYRNYAEELRLIGASGASKESMAALEKVARGYDQLGATMEAIDRSKRAYGLKKPNPK